MAHPKEKEAYALGEKMFYLPRRPATTSRARPATATTTAHPPAGPAQPDQAGRARSRPTRRWPAYRVSQGELRTFQWRLNDCFRQQRFPELKFTSDASIALTTFLARNANGAEFDAPDDQALHGDRHHAESQHEDRARERGCRRGARRLRGSMAPGPSDAEARAKALEVMKASFNEQGRRSSTASTRTRRRRCAAQYATGKRCRRTSPRRSRRRTWRRSSHPPTASTSATGRAASRSRSAASACSTPTTKETPVGGNCYACHQLTQSRDLVRHHRPVAVQFGKIRGYGPTRSRSTPTARCRTRRPTSACSIMPRFGHSGHPHRAADQGRRRAADGSGVAGQQVTDVIHPEPRAGGAGSRDPIAAGDVPEPMRRATDADRRAREVRRSHASKPGTARHTVGRPGVPVSNVPERRTMNRREFLNVLAVAAAAGLPVAARAALDQRRRREALRRVKPFGNVSLLHFTDCHAQLLPVHFREPNVNLGVGDARGQAAAPRRRGAAQALRHRAGHARGARVHLPRLRGGGARLRQGRRLRAPRHAGEAAAGVAPGRAAARRRRHLAGLGTALWTNGQDMVDAASSSASTSMTGALGVHARRRAREADRREGLRGQDRLRRAEREDHRLRRPGVHALRDPPRSTACRSRSSARRSRTRRSPTRATSCPTGRSASRKRTCRRSSTRRAARARRSWCCCRTTAWTST